MAETIITVRRRKGFTVLSNSTLRDNRLSLKTRAVLAIMVSMPDGWDYTVSGLAVICGVGKDAVRTSLRELEANGYLTRVQQHNEAGHFSRNEYIVTDEPTGGGEIPLPDEPSTDEPLTDQPLTDNPTQQNKDCTNTPYNPPEGEGRVDTRTAPEDGVDWALFEQFWAAYPRKQNKEKARRAWRKLRPDEALCRVMAEALERDKRGEQWRRDNGSYIPHPSSWLNGRRWEDEAPAPEAASRTPLRGEGVRYL